MLLPIGKGCALATAFDMAPYRDTQLVMDLGALKQELKQEVDKRFAGMSAKTSAPQHPSPATPPFAAARRSQLAAAC